MQVRPTRQGYKLVKSSFGKHIEIPTDWDIIRIADIGDIITGNTPSTTNTEFYGNEYLWATPPDLGTTRFVTDTQTKLSRKGFEETRPIPPKAVLVTCIGTIGKVGMSIKEMATNQQINSVICRECKPEYLYYQLSFNQEKIRNMANQAVVPILNKGDFGLFKAVVPRHNEEQQKIASILSKVDDLIQKTDEIIEQTKRLKKGLMQLLTKGIGHTKFKTVEFVYQRQTEIPEDWSVLTIDSLIKSKSDIKAGPFGSLLKKEFFVQKGFKVYGQEHVIANDFTIGDYYIPEGLFEKMKTYEVKPRDVLISLVGTELIWKLIDTSV